MNFRQILKQLLGIALFFLMVMIAVYVLFSTIWSKSAECSTSCKRLRSARTEDPAKQYPDESWADIPEELYSFFTPPPRLLPKETSERKCLKNSPPVGFVIHKSPQQKGFTYSGLAAVLVRKWVLMRSHHLNKTSSNMPQIYVRFNSKYASKGGEVIRVIRIAYFKLLAALFLEHAISTECMELASLLTDKAEINTYTIFTTMWPGSKYEFESREMRNLTQYKNSSTGDNCVPMFIKPHNTYVLCGFIRCTSETNNEIFIFQNDNGTYRQWLESL